MVKKVIVVLMAAAIFELSGCCGQKHASLCKSESLKTVWLDELDISKATSGLNRR